MVKPENLSLFVILINKMIFYYEKGEQFIKLEEINSIDKYINDHLDEVQECNKKVYKSIKEDIKTYTEKIKTLSEKQTQPTVNESIVESIEISKTYDSTLKSEDRTLNYNSKEN